MKRSHRNTKRLTARERAEACEKAYFESQNPLDTLACFIERALQAHARETLERHKRRCAGILGRGTIE